MILHRVATRLVVFDRGEVNLFEGSYQDFLDRVGWSGESEEAGPSAATPKSKKEQRQERAEIQRVLGPLKKKVNELEEEIVAEEVRAKSVNEQLLVASAKQDAARIAELSKELHQSGQRINKLFEKLEKATEELKGKEAEAYV